MPPRPDFKHPDSEELTTTRRNNRDRTEYSVGDELSGQITGIAHFGLFVRLPNRESGLVFKHEVCWPGEDIAYGIGDEVTVQVMGFKAGRGLSLSIRQPRADRSFREFVTTHKVGDSIAGTVKSVVGYGVFVTLTPGVCGLLHVSAMQNHSAFDKQSIGAPIEVRIADIDIVSKRITLEMA